jgi:hypothetical protein
MQFYHNQPTGEFLDWLRDSAIKGGMPPQFIYKVDELRSVEDQDAEIEGLQTELGEVEKNRDDLREELEQAAESLELAIDTIASIAKSPQDAADMIDADELRGLQRQLDFTQKALERHK